MSSPERLRLARLLRRFQISTVTSTSTAKTGSTPQDLRRAYYAVAKSAHPDFAPDDLKPIAEKNFIAMREQYEEAQLLLQAGVQPTVTDFSTAAASEDAAAASSSPESGAWMRWSRMQADERAHDPFSRHAADYGKNPYAAGGEYTQWNRWEDFDSKHERYRYTYSAGYKRREARAEPGVIRDFDWATKAKAFSLVFFGGAIFLAAMRELAVAVAGSCWAYRPPWTSNMFVIRRWHEQMTDDEFVVKENQPIRPSHQTRSGEAGEEDDRIVSDYYAQRMVSNRSGMSKEERLRRSRSVRVDEDDRRRQFEKATRLEKKRREQDQARTATSLSIAETGVRSIAEGWGFATAGGTRESVREIGRDTTRSTPGIPDRNAGSSSVDHGLTSTSASSRQQEIQSGGHQRVSGHQHSREGAVVRQEFDGEIARTVSAPKNEESLPPSGPGASRPLRRRNSTGSVVGLNTAVVGSTSDSGSTATLSKVALEPESEPQPDQNDNLPGSVLKIPGGFAKSLHPGVFGLGGGTATPTGRNVVSHLHAPEAVQTKTANEAWVSSSRNGREPVYGIQTARGEQSTSS